jgi:hypothetical protein
MNIKQRRIPEKEDSLTLIKAEGGGKVMRL